MKSFFPIESRWQDNVYSETYDNACANIELGYGVIIQVKSGTHYVLATGCNGFVFLPFTKLTKQVLMSTTLMTRDTVMICMTTILYLVGCTITG